MQIYIVWLVPLWRYKEFKVRSIPKFNYFKFDFCWVYSLDTLWNIRPTVIKRIWPILSCFWDQNGNFLNISSPNCMVVLPLSSSENNPVWRSNMFVVIFTSEHNFNFLLSNFNGSMKWNKEPNVNDNVYFSKEKNPN